MKKTPKKFLKPTITIPLDSALELIDKVVEYQKVKEQEETKRLRLEREIKEVKLRTRLFEKTFDKLFEENVKNRDVVLRMLLEAFNKAMEEKNADLLKFVLTQAQTFLEKDILSYEEKEFLMKLINFEKDKDEEEIPAEIEL